MKDTKKGNSRGRILLESLASSWIAVLTRIALITILLMSIYEVAIRWLFPNITERQSHIATVVFSTAVATAGAYIAFRTIIYTKHTQAVEALRASEQRWQALFNRIPIGLYRTTVDGQIIEANPALVEMLRYPDRESLLKINAADVFANPDDRLREQAILEQTGIAEYEMQLRRYNKSIIWVRDNVRAVQDADGRMLYFDGSLQDITEHKRAEEYVRRTERLAAMGKITASLAHEIKNPLQAIQSNLELMRDYSLESDERDACLQICCREVEHLIGITQRVLSYSKPEDDIVDPISIPQVWQQMLALLAQSLEQANIQVTTDFPANIPPVMGVMEQVNQVLLNLVLNACEAMPDGGLLHVTAYGEGESLVLTMTNNGPSIPTDQLDHIFDPFYTTKPDGTGLGLFICHNIIQYHGGDLNVENRIDEPGVVYTIRLPIAVRQHNPTGRKEPKGRSDLGIGSHVSSNLVEESIP